MLLTFVKKTLNGRPLVSAHEQVLRPTVLFVRSMSLSLLSVLLCNLLPSSQDDLATRLRKRIQESSVLQKAKAVHSRITESDPIDKVCMCVCGCVGGGGGFALFQFD